MRQASTTVMPMERQCRPMIFAAWSMSCALRSVSLVLAISRTWSQVTLATFGLVRLAGALLDARGLEQAAWRAGRRLQLKSNDRSSYTEISPDDVPTLRLGRGGCRLAELHDVDAVLTQTGPTGGAGLAAPALSAALMIAASFFFLGGIPVPVLYTFPAYCRDVGMRPRCDRQILDDLGERELDRGLPAEDRHQTFSFCPSMLTSEIVAGSVANGPSMTVTDSPISKSTSTEGPPSCEEAGGSPSPCRTWPGLPSRPAGRGTSAPVHGQR